MSASRADAGAVAAKGPDSVLDAFEEYLRRECGTTQVFREPEGSIDDLGPGFTPGRDLLTDVVIWTPQVSGRWARVDFTSLMNPNYWIAILQRDGPDWVVVTTAGPKAPDDWDAPLREAGCPEPLLGVDW